MPRRATILGIASAATLLLIGSVFLAPSHAEANFFKDLWESLKNPFGVESPRGAPQDEGEAPATNLPEPPAQPTPLYKPALEYEQAVIAAVKKASPAVVSIIISKNVPIIEQCPIDPFSDLPLEIRPFFGDGFGFSAPCERGTRLQEVGGGSGFIISADGLIITNKHVISDEGASYTVFTNDGKQYDGAVVARDPIQDLAIVRINARDLPVVELGDSDAIELGQTAIAIGNTLGEFRNTVSVGVISGLARDVTASSGRTVETIRGVVQTDAAINPGNSGGPLLNLRGEVIGINTAIASGAENVGFAIPINDAKRDINSVKASGEIQAPYLGVRYVLVTPELAKREELPVEYGALLRSDGEGPAVVKGSPAAKAGLQAEDIVVEVNGVRIDKEHDLGLIVSRLNVGQVITLRVRRDNSDLRFTTALVKRP